MTPPDQAAQAVDKALALIDFEPEFADTHGGCPPAYRGGHFTGKADAKAALLALMYQQRINELKHVEPAAYTNVTEEFGNQTVTERIKELEATAKRYGQIRGER